MDAVDVRLDKKLITSFFPGFPSYQLVVDKYYYR